LCHVPAERAAPTPSPARPVLECRGPARAVVQYIGHAKGCVNFSRTINNAYLNLIAYEGTRKPKIRSELCALYQQARQRFVIATVGGAV
jgi:hypothetical protein